jgi:hypothetical protein
MKKLKKKEFINLYCEGSNISKKELFETQTVVRCNCDYKSCYGWIVVNRLNYLTFIKNK